MRRSVLVLVILAMVVASCGGSSDSGDASESTSGTGLPEDVSRCEETDPLVLDYLRTGVTADGVTLPWGFSVKSTDFDDVWIVAAGVDGERASGYGTWAIRASVWPTDYIGAVSVDEIAMLVSDWGDDVDVIVTPAIDGVRSAGACAIARLDS